MKLVDELKGIIEVNIKEDVLAEKLFDKAVEPLVLKLLDLIPTEIDDMFYASRREEAKAMFKELISQEVEKVEEKIDEVLDAPAVESSEEA